MEFVIGFLIGGIAVCIIFAFFKVGTLRVIHDPDGDYMFLELDKSVSAVTSKKYVIMKVSQK